MVEDTSALSCGVYFLPLILCAVAVTEKDLSKDADSKFENAVLKKLDGQLGGLLSDAMAEEDFTGH
jgi:leucyl aminopeptidase